MGERGLTDYDHLARMNCELAADVQRFRKALQAITEVFCNAPEQKNDTLVAIAFAGAFSRCQAIAELALAGEREEE